MKYKTKSRFFAPSPFDLSVSYAIFANPNRQLYK